MTTPLCHGKVYKIKSSYPKELTLSAVKKTNLIRFKMTGGISYAYEGTLRITQKKIEAYRARNFADAERWDLEFWQKQSPDARLSALVSIRNDIKKVRGRRKRSYKQL